MGSNKFPTPVTVNTDDLTLDELDRASKLTADGSCGNLAALAFVYLKREHPVKLADVKQLRQRDVVITNDDELAAAQGDDESGASTAADPTN